MNIKVFIKIVYVLKLVIYTKYTMQTQFIIDTRNILINEIHTRIIDFETRQYTIHENFKNFTTLSCKA